MLMKRMLNEDNQIHNFISSFGSFGFGTVINYGSGSDFPTFFQITVPVPVPLFKKLRFLRFRFRFHNTGTKGHQDADLDLGGGGGRNMPVHSKNQRQCCGAKELKIKVPATLF